MGGTYRPAPVNLQALASCARRAAIQTRGMIRILCVVLFAAMAFADDEARGSELTPAVEQRIREVLRSTRFHKVSLDKMNAREALDYFATRLRGAGTPLNMVASFGNKDLERTITWHAKNPTAEELLNEICRQGKLRWECFALGIKISP